LAQELILTETPNASGIAAGDIPVFWDTTRGANIWDVDGNEYIDWVNAVSAVILGHADDAVDNAVIEQIRRGSIYTLNSPLEIELAEELQRTIPSAQMARYTKGGGEACAVAARIARGTTGRDIILFCGYHGWHDWYLAANLSGPDTLNSHARKLLKFLNLKLDEYDPSHEALIVLDTHSRRLLGNFSIEKADIVIDHHLKQDSIDARHAIIDSSYSSTSEIVYEILKQLGPVNDTAATCILAGMISDSACFKNASRRTFQYISEAMGISKVDYGELLEVIDSRPDVSQRMAVLKAVQRCELERVGDFLIASSNVNACESLAAESLVNLGADVAFVAYSGEDARISARMRLGLEDRLNLALVMAEAGKILGGSGGGHEMAAGANGPNIPKLEEALEKCLGIAREKLKGKK
jgi:nanoRNase/pAp phosphatase (c-di-AMP/oligoRNAs hydrolase)